MKKQKISTDSASTSTSTKKEDQINKISLKRQIEKPSENTPKKAKRNPLKDIKLGETMIDATLKILVADSVRVVKEKVFVWSFVATDGFEHIIFLQILRVDYVTVSMWDKTFQRLYTELGSDFLGKTYMFQTFCSKQIQSQYNYGSVPYELRAQDSSTITICTKDFEIKEINQNNYFDFLTQKFTIDTDFTPIMYEQLQFGTENVNVEVEVYSVNELRTVSAKGNQESKVLDVAILINNHKAQLTGWNIISEFLYYMLKGQEGKKICLQCVSLKAGFGSTEYIFTFNNASKIKIEEKDSSQQTVTSLTEMHQKFGTLKYGVLTITVHDSTSISKHNDKQILCNVDELDYPSKL
uniref:Uncharacterized protein n=1 Tax=Meloidogyne javanica TaxID=6303 RepID=A0A915N3P1_MELJA